MLKTILDFFMNNEIATLIIFGALLLLILVMFILLIVSMVKLRGLRKRYDTFMKDDDGESLEAVIDKHLSEIDGLLSDTKTNAAGIEKLNNQIRYTFQKIGLVKYDAFDEMGGKLSFTLALLNEREDGFVINAVHSREGCYTYIKDIISGKSVVPLSAEEQEALDDAKKDVFETKN